ncbi:hypothetical protein VT84_15705 [Gemmata sp. SH-PL17]|uniref:DUF2252 family protein n=1 Tax=Gemmata sp. SH-PL17 TaxID=1630693 RepID=UPI00078B4999|nr:DUF2252 family protein [Gemmata sp. SH-PL17]AMV25843.1 hypothetical protein VT84_15705 [Gemmata sp. SH-PL17]
MIHIVAATQDYEAWLARFFPLHAPDLAFKRERMADPNDPFPFFRGTYYRWPAVWAATCPELVSAPRVAGVGDLHVENFGTWRDVDGRLCWGVNDFDEADEIPYTSDLVRLAASARLARKSGALDIKTSDACRVILDGYRDALAAGGTPFVLEEHHPDLRTVGMASERAPIRFWAKLTKLLDEPVIDPPPAARDALVRELPSDARAPAFRFRARAGMGSLGRPRFVALVEWRGGWMCREAKAIAPPATEWAAGTAEPATSKLAEVVERAVRAPDPFYRVEGGWVLRRLAPRCSRIELDHLKKIDTGRVLTAMGAETANVHLGTPGAASAVLRHVVRLPAGWLERAAKDAAAAVERDWQAWRQARNSKG